MTFKKKKILSRGFFSWSKEASEGVMKVKAGGVQHSISDILHANIVSIYGHQEVHLEKTDVNKLFIWTRIICS